MTSNSNIDNPTSNLTILPEAVRKVVSNSVDWDKFEAALASLPEYAGPSAGRPLQRTALPPDYSKRVKDAFNSASRHLGDGAKRIRRKENLWFTVAVVPVFVAVAAPLFVERLGNAWYGVVVAAIGQGGFLTVFFTQVLNYLRGGDALDRFITQAQIAFDLCLTPEDHRAAMKWFLDISGRLQGTPPPQSLPPAPPAAPSGGK